MLSKPVQSALRAKPLQRLAQQKPVQQRPFHSSQHVRQAAAGLNFSLSEEQQSYRDMARKFAREEIAPVAAEHDRTGKYPQELIKKAHELGIMTMHLPERVGGQGLGLVDSCKR